MAQLIIHIDDDVLNKIRIHGLNFDSKYIRHVEKSILDASALTNESKQLLSDYQRLFNSLNGDYKLSQVQISELSHSIGTALDTMLKYQKIEEIIKNTQQLCSYGNAFIDIREVIEDRNDNNEKISGNGLTTADVKRRMNRIINSGDGTYEFDIRIDTDDILCIKYLLSLMK